MKKQLLPRIVFVSFILLFWASNSYAVWTGYATVTGIFVANEDLALIKLSSSTNPHNCDTDYRGDVVINPTTHKSWYTLILTAFAAGKQVDFYVAAGCKTIWPGTSYAIAGHVRTK